MIVGNEGNEQAADFVIKLVKTIRGYGGIFVSATQNTIDYFAPRDEKFGDALLNNSRLKLLLQKAGYRMEADGQYRSGAVLERRFRTAEIASFFWRMGVDVFGEAPPTERGSGQPQGVRRLEPHQAPGALRRNVIT